MFRRKLLALEYSNAESVDVNDEKQFRVLILWLENMKIRNYKIEDRQGLANVDSAEWKNHFNKYLDDLECPFKNGSRMEQMEWLLGYAVKLEYSDNVEKYKHVTSEYMLQKQTDAPKVVSSNPLDSLDFQSEDFKKGIQSLAQLLNITEHPDHLVTLQAISKLICERLKDDVVKNPNAFIPKGKSFPFEDCNPGFTSQDEKLSAAAKILRMLFIQDLRALQTLINECIVAAQKVTANPKTDTKLGKVGF